MPKMSGEKFAGEILALNQTVPIILYTGFSEMLSRDKALAMGIQAYVQKPVPMSEIVRIVWTLLDYNVRIQSIASVSK